MPQIGEVWVGSIYHNTKTKQYVAGKFVVRGVANNRVAFEGVLEDGDKKTESVGLDFFLSRCAPYEGTPPTNANVVRTIVKTREVFISEYNETWVDRLYNWYCDFKSRTRQKESEIIIDNPIEEEE